MKLDIVINGDCLEELKKLDSNIVHLIITSPPYNIGMKYDNYFDNKSIPGYLSWLMEIWKECCRVLVIGGRICIVIGETNRITKDIVNPTEIIYHNRVPTYAHIINQLIELGMLYRGTIIWNKEQTFKVTAWGSWKACSNPHVVPRHEYIVIFSKDCMKLEGDSNKCDLTREEFIDFTNPIWDITPTSHKEHPATFPEEIVKRLIKLYSYQENVVLDPFAGSGTTGYVASNLNRKYILIEQSKYYCNIINKALIQTKQKSIF